MENFEPMYGIIENYKPEDDIIENSGSLDGTVDASASVQDGVKDDIELHQDKEMEAVTESRNGDNVECYFQNSRCLFNHVYKDLS